MGEGPAVLSLGLKAGDWVEVRSREEILRTLDKNGRFEELPFMPQMLAYCGQKLQVNKRVHKLCCIVADTIGRRMSNAVTLENIRCDGQAYGGCEMQCMVLWKEAWLKRADVIETDFTPVRQGGAGKTSVIPNGGACTEDDLWAGTRAPEGEGGSSEPLYICQATQVPHATERLSQWGMKQYIDDYVSGNVRLSRILSRLCFQFYQHYLVYSGLGFGTVLRWAFNIFQKVTGNPPFPWQQGALPKNSRTPSVNLNLRVGELVRVKDYREIRRTLDEEGKNRGMSFHAELSRHCGKTFRVSHRVRKAMNERTGQLLQLKNECLILDGADCDGKYTNPLNCPRAAYPYWREIWLERVSENSFGTEDKQNNLSSCR